MNDEDEIDVLGDFKLDIILSKGDSNIYDGSSLVSQNSDLLNCDYTIHPQWFLDRPSANPDNWYTNTRGGLPDKEDEALSHFVSTENSITDESGWTEKEKNLLERGIEIFGKSNERLSQFIGSKVASEVKYYLKNFYSEHHNNRRSNEALNSNINLVDGILDDNQIPTSIEEVIAAVSTAKPTIQTLSKKSRKNVNSSSSMSDREFPRLKSSLKPFHRSPSKQRNPQRKGSEYASKKGKSSVKTSKLASLILEKKRKDKLPFGRSMNVCQKNTIKQKVVKVINAESKEDEIKTVEITTGRGLAVPICEGEEIVKIRSGTEDSDTDIDVELSDEDFQSSQPKLPKLENDCLKVGSDTPKVEVKTETPETNTKDATTVSAKPSIDPGSFSEKLQKELTSMEEPKCEIVLAEQTVTDLEKVIHRDYFDGSVTKTPERYLKIRNHILKGWKSHKPNYLFKTFSRQGLKNCGDVNSFGRIHNFLEQIGAINFGCDQVSYYRPLIEMLQEQAPTKERKKIDMKTVNIASSSNIGARSRHKPKLFNKTTTSLANTTTDIELHLTDLCAKCFKEDSITKRGHRPVIYCSCADIPGGYGSIAYGISQLLHEDGEGGYTLSHDEHGRVIKHTVINQEPAVKQKAYFKKPIIRLIYCRPFTEEFQQPYNVKISLSALLTMDFHSHTSLTEVMGIVAGFWIPQSKTLTISHYEPCNNMASSATHCDMCPISQAKAADTIHTMGYDILGWFHSHPTFAPEPSNQDLETQQIVQQWIGQDRPCIGVILSPFSSNGAFIASPLRCMIVNKKQNFEDQIVPYKFIIEVDSDGFLVKDCLRDLKRILEFNLGCSKEKKVDFEKPYFQDESITFLEKFITSVRMRTARCGTLSKRTCNDLITGVEHICLRN